MSAHCPECGFAGDEGANFCQRCGASLRGESLPGEAGGEESGGGLAGGDSITATYRIDESGELVPVELGHVTAHGPALVIRAGGGRVGESFAVAGERMSIGRRPDSEVFLDDITVSRDHALLIGRGDQWHIDDCGSLNGTYVNRERIESHRLEDGDELQIGKYKLTFYVR
jgi:pSer/pThr/pTyr-binding forkhead associated (FHA) protein